MAQQAFWDWFRDAFANLPRSHDPFFKRLWGDRLLCFNQLGQTPDALDEWSARLVCAILERRKRLFIVLPDSQPRRPALLFATGLIMSTLDHLRTAEAALQAQRVALTQNQEAEPPVQPIPECRILYFGSTVGIREQLKHIEVQGGMQLNLADVFQQRTTVRGKSTQTRPIGRRSRRRTAEEPEVHLPGVLYIYAPADPIALLQEYQPHWVAIDCSDEAELRWLRPLLQYALTQEIPMIAWGHNPLSECVTDFAQVGDIFRWAAPPSLLTPTISQLRAAPELAFHPGVTTSIQPVVLEGPQISDLAASVWEASRVLVRGVRRSSTPLGKEALRLHWGYLRSLEALSVPCDFHEIEAPRLWGLKSFTQWQAVCEQFRATVSASHPDLAGDLEQANACLEATIGYFRIAEPPLWSTLAALCTEEAPAGVARLIIFSSTARRQLFSLALLARHNLTEADLHAHRVWLLSLAELWRIVRWRAFALENNEEFAPFQIDTSLRWHPIVVGLPSPLVTPKLLPVLQQETVDVLLYPHQITALTRQVREWAGALNPDLSRAATILSQLIEITIPEDCPAIPSRLYEQVQVGRLTTDEPVIKKARVVSLLPLEDPVSEVARLLRVDEDIDDDDSTARIGADKSVESTDTDDSSLWCHSAIEIEFDQGWRARFAPDETMNIIVANPSGLQTDERYVRALQHGDRVVVIYGQRRQSLYHLIISRVHHHPAIELHLALIRRWQEDFAVAYSLWRQHGVRNLEALLLQMQQRGSTLVSSLTLRQWLRGETLCPQDEKDLYRLAAVLDLAFVQQYQQRIYQAANRLRGLHRGLAHRLNRWLEQQAAGLTTGSDDDVIDAELGLTFGDFRSSLIILRVVAVQTVVGLFMRSDLGKLERNTSYEQPTAH